MQMKKGSKFRSQRQSYLTFPLLTIQFYPLHTFLVHNLTKRYPSEQCCHQHELTKEIQHLMFSLSV